MNRQNIHCVLNVYQDIRTRSRVVWHMKMNLPDTGNSTAVVTLTSFSVKVCV